MTTLKPLASIFGATILAVAVLAGAVFARDAQTYNAATFDAAQKSNQHIVVEVFKHGCPTCKLQQPGLKEARQRYPDAVFFKVDFEGASAPVKKFRAVRQSTIIVFKGQKEVARLVGETDKDAIVRAIAEGA